MRKFIITEEEKNSIRKMYLMEQSTTPGFGIAVGDTLNINNVDIPNIGKGDLNVEITNPDSTPNNPSMIRPKFEVANFKYKPPMTLVDAEKSIYKDDKGVERVVPKSSAQSKVILTIKAGDLFKFNLYISGGETPTISTSNFIEGDKQYDFAVGKYRVEGETRKNLIKNALGNKIPNPEDTKRIFANQEWVKTIQTSLPKV